jgi:uncharacterized protein (TIGR02231 family)
MRVVHGRYYFAGLQKAAQICRSFNVHLPTIVPHLRFWRENTMRSIIAGLMISTALSGFAKAADFVPASKIDAVTVYMQGADVVRLANVTLAKGEHRVILKDLPADIDPQSIRVEGLPSVAGSLAVASVDTRNQFTGSEDSDQRRLAFEAQIQTLSDERGTLDTIVNDSNQQRQFLIGLADKQLVPQSSTDNVKSIDVTQLTGLLDLVGARLALLAKTSQSAQLRQRDIDKAVAELQAKMAELAPDEQYQTEVIINVETSADVTADLRVSYRVNEATWSPYYDAKLDIGDAAKPSTIEVIQRAEVTQSTGEIWDNVALTLSTARPSGATAAPEINEEEVAAIQQQRVTAAAPEPSPERFTENKAKSERDQLQQDAEKPDATVRRKDLVNLQKQAVVEMAGFQANYKIETRVSVDNSGQSKKVRITSATQNAKLEAIAVPRLDPVAYLTAKYTMKGSGPQLAGPVNLYLEGTYVGQGALPLLNAGEEAKLGFGVDDQMKVTRKEVKRLSGEEGILTSSNVEERVWDIAIENLHDVAMDVTVFDRVPFASQKDIEISEIEGMTKPTIRGVDKKRGVHSWTQKLEPKAKGNIKVGYRIAWPQGMQVGLVD